MRVPHIAIQSIDAYIGIRSNKPHPQMKQHTADLQIRQTHTGIIEINTKSAELSIDQTQAFAEANLKTPFRLADEFYQRAQQKAAEHLTKRRQQGDQMMKIENGFGVLARLAKVNSEKPQGQLQTVNMPRSVSSTKIHFEPAQVSFRVPNHQTDIKVNRREPDIHIPKWQTETYVKQKNSISFQAVGAAIDSSL
ncbi:hypothetical protein BTR22_05110 [Alkalihalophilus pseudofirmus]|uniref:DUF6470 family protein n=1 Tax=Alkalihalophilus pseudofirmus TaxID=79885 RepID=UPI000951E982|nr:hypothetical protein BTR22_05110 [Alkalihalophilus pseudofirmus]